MNSWNVPGQSDARGAIRNLAKTNIIFVLATRFRGGARVPARLVFRHVFIATFDAPIPTCANTYQKIYDPIHALICEKHVKMRVYARHFKKPV